MGKRPSYPASSDPDPLPDGMFYPCSWSLYTLVLLQIIGYAGR